ncbi:hypothetical protein [Anianabacter salinae]|uniref:hypothetical protein n=1 Tax=Anianabacter salinae TaxID=2851023 RepID=UPI00225E1BEC|nr:hypothetical protein [Anianabacter salinae]MBV0911118.1 hypothetical protein [Anianabacter salinae]
MKTVLALRLGGAAAQLALTALLAATLPATDLGRVLLVLSLAGLGAALVSAGTAQVILREASRDPGGAPAALSAGLRRGMGPLLGLCGLVLLAAEMALVPLGRIEAVALCAAAASSGAGNLAAAVLRADGRTCLAVAVTGCGRPVLSLVLAAAALGLTGDPGLALAACVAAQVLCTGVAFAAAPSPCLAGALPPANAMWGAQTGWLLLSQIDVLAAGALLPPAQLAVYLAARRVAAVVTLAQDAVRLIHAPRVARAAPPDLRAAIAAADASYRRWSVAAGVLLACLGVALLPVTSVDVPPVYFVLVAAFTSPAVAGAAGLALAMTGQERRHLGLLCVSLPLAGLAASCAATAGAAPLAAAFGASLLCHTVAARHLIARHLLAA